MVDISLKKTFQQQEYGLSNLSNGIVNNIEVDLRHAYDASEADFFRPKFSFHVSSPDKVISKANKFGTAERYHALYIGTSVTYQLLLFTGGVLIISEKHKRQEIVI